MSEQFMSQQKHMKVLNNREWSINNDISKITDCSLTVEVVAIFYSIFLHCDFI